MDGTYNLHYALAAQQDLDDIWDYVMREISDAETAEKVTDKIMNAIDNLARFPRMGATLASITSVACPYRFIVVEKYMVFYRVEDKDVYVDRILHGKRDYLSILFDAWKDNET